MQWRGPLQPAKSALCEIRGEKQAVNSLGMRERCMRELTDNARLPVCEPAHKKKAATSQDTQHSCVAVRLHMNKANVWQVSSLRNTHRMLLAV